MEAIQLAHEEEIHEDGEAQDTYYGLIPEFSFVSAVAPGYWREEHDLWYAVLMRAIKDFKVELALQIKDKTVRNPRLYELKGWLKSNDERVGSLHFICHTLMLNPDIVRRHCIMLWKIITKKGMEVVCRKKATSSTTRTLSKSKRSAKSLPISNLPVISECEPCIDAQVAA